MHAPSAGLFKEGAGGAGHAVGVGVGVGVGELVGVEVGVLVGSGLAGGAPLQPHSQRSRQATQSPVIGSLLQQLLYPHPQEFLLHNGCPQPPQPSLSLGQPSQLHWPQLTSEQLVAYPKTLLGKIAQAVPKDNRQRTNAFLVIVLQ